MQKRFIGYQEDLTQENFLFMVKANSIPGVKYGMQATLNLETLVLTIKPGYMILPDGMIIGETSPVSIQFLEPGSGDYWATLVASRLIEPGMLNDEVRYEIVQNRVASDALSNITNLVRMPLAWIQKIGNNLFLTDLGRRSSDFLHVLTPPFPEIYASNVSVNYTNGVMFRTFRNSDGALYLRIPRDLDSYIYSIQITAKGDSSTVLDVEALKTHQPGTLETIKSSMAFSAAEYTTQSLLYPFQAYTFEDVLKLNVSGVPSVNISEISIIRVGLF